MALYLRKEPRAWVLVGPSLTEIADAAIQNCSHTQNILPHTQKPYHITLFSKDELEHLSPARLEQINQESSKLDTKHIFAAGVGGGENGVFFVVIIWAAGQQLRRRLGLSPKHFHITLTDHNDDEMDRSIRSLLPGQPSSLVAEFLDHSSFTSFIFSHYLDAKNFALELIKSYPDSQKGFLRYGDASFAVGSFKSAMLAYAQTHDRTNDHKLQNYCIKKMTDCSRETEWGSVLQEREKAADIPIQLLTPWSTPLQDKLSDLEATPSLCLEPRDALFVPTGSKIYHKLPRFFRWIIPYHLAVMSTPKNEEDIDILTSPHFGIRHVLTLTEESPLPSSWFKNKSISNTFLPVPNYHPPSIEQMDIIMQLMNDEKRLPVLVHCGGGKGRAGTVIACYLATCGFKKLNPYITQPEMAASEAVNVLRSIRPGSIETSQQEQFVSKWCSTIWKRQSIFPERPSEPPPCPMEIEGTITADSNLLILVGLPGSGKSWFSNALIARAPQRYRRISQDEIGGRAACEAAMSRNPGTSFTLLDRCNTSDTDRKEWLKLTSNWATSPVCVWFDYTRELCTSRAQMRIGHPTLPPGSRVRKAIAQMQEQFVKPTLSEGFAAVVRIASFQAALELIWHLFPPPTTVFKFPRTAHLIDVGGATTDDIVSQDYLLGREAFGRVIVTEKVDGANMGISLSSDRSRILIQNRSHFVNPQTHEQFKKLGKWVEQHRLELYQILDRDPYYAERYVLFGEWVYATHSIAYTHLPDLFITFDLFDRSTRQFMDRTTLEAVLRSTTIGIVPIICELQNELPSRERLLGLIESTSQFYDGRVEGVYVKVETHGVVQTRGKVVRGDFISGNEHWTKSGLRPNGIVTNT